MRRRRHNRPKPKPKVTVNFRVNEQILADRVFLIGADDIPVGEISRDEAFGIARAAEADLVEVSPLATPPVCKILDYGKFLYHESKKEQHAKTKQRKVDIKGIRLGMNTDKHDLFFKRSQAEKFLAKGHKVKVELFLRGREKAMGDRAKETITVFIDGITTPHKVEEEIKRGPKGFTVVVVAE